MCERRSHKRAKGFITSAAATSPKHHFVFLKRKIQLPKADIKKKKYLKCQNLLQEAIRPVLCLFFSLQRRRELQLETPVCAFERHFSAAVTSLRLQSTWTASSAPEPRLEPRWKLHFSPSPTRTAAK